MAGLAALEDVAAKTLWSHVVGKIVDELDTDDSDAIAALMTAAPELVKSPGCITMWRTADVYGEGRTAHEVATRQFVASIALIAAWPHTVAATAGHRIGEHDSGGQASPTGDRSSRPHGRLRHLHGQASAELLAADSPGAPPSAIGFQETISK